MKKALIMGVNGQDGAYLANLLLSKGYEVFGGSRDAQLSSFANLAKLGVKEKINLVSININDFRSTLHTIAKIVPDEIYNLAGQSSVGLSFEQPVESFESITLGTLNILESIRFIGKKTKFYNAGSSESFGDTNGVAADETTPFRPRSPYAVAKSAAFWQVANYREAYDIFACTGILFNHESPLRPERFVTQKIISTACRISNGEKIMLKLGNIDILRDWGWAPEYVEAMWRMLQQPYADDFVIATGETCSLRDFVKTTFEKLSLDWEKHVQIDSALYRPTDLKISRSNPTKAREKLFWKSNYNLDDVISEMIKDKIKINF